MDTFQHENSCQFPFDGHERQELITFYKLFLMFGSLEKKILLRYATNHANELRHFSTQDS